ncbi:OmpA family protein [Hanamia caeni]|uniref:OmpA family protein n=1 Tax=Hanamia caeni TaxID=2294116 RepID=A0A3M9NBW6_9BACT|nr:OmpA family protein [Hanamia caeni]RNI34885.1 OmpA family protein [Hanamia caeni]
MKLFKPILCILPVIALLMMGCNATRTQKGAVIGGTAGAVGGTIIGKAAGNKTLGTILGAAIGGTAGAIIGHDMDKQAEEIQDQIPGAKVERIDEGIKVEFNEKILFAFSKSDLSDSAKMNLDKLATALKNYPNTNIEIQGHTDSRGTEEYNMGLSLRRANAVRDYLVSQGIDGSRMTVKGYGESAPAYSNDTPEGMAQNRRVEFLITANDKMKADAEKKADNQNQ